MGINKTTEEMIQMFLKYGTKQSLSVDEFLLLRKQVVDEILCGVKIENSEPMFANREMQNNGAIINNAEEKQENQQMEYAVSQWEVNQVQQKSIINQPRQKQQIVQKSAVTQVVKPSVEQSIEQPIETTYKQQKQEPAQEAEQEIEQSTKKKEATHTTEKKTGKEEKKETQIIKNEPNFEDDDEKDDGSFSDSDFLKMMREIDD